MDTVLPLVTLTLTQFEEWANFCNHNPVEYGNDEGGLGVGSYWIINKDGVKIRFVYNTETAAYLCAYIYMPNYPDIAHQVFIKED